MTEQRISGNVVDVVAKRIFGGTIVVRDGIIAEIVEEPVSSDHYIIPGFIDSHVHIESSLLIPSEFARLAVRQGTVATVSDPHEIGNVLGVEGVEFMIQNGGKVPFHFFFGAPSCVPATQFETAGATIEAGQIDQLLSRKDIWYLAEMMNYPGVIHRDDQVHLKLASAKKHGKVIDGHAPGLRGEAMDTYFDAGISTDHECFTTEEGREKLQYGVKVLIREGSAAKNFNALIALLDEFPEQIMFCTDDAHPNYLAKKHINKLAARAIEFGCDLWNVLRACSLNPVTHYKLPVGLLQKDDPADFCVVSDLSTFDCLETYISGIKVFDGQSTSIKRVPEIPVNQFNCEAIEASSLAVKSSTGNVRVIEVTDGQLVTGNGRAVLSARSGFLQSDIAQDILKLVVVNRYNQSPPAVAFVKGFGFKHGAIASSVAHDCHNVIAVGVNDDEILNAINTVIRHKGGLSLVSQTDASFIQLPFAGLMTDTDGVQLAEDYDKLQTHVADLGGNLYDPYMTLSFCALLVIPSLKLSDRGLFDGERFEFVELVV